MSLGDQIRHGTKWSFFSNFSSQAFQFLFGIALARILVPADFGVIVTVKIFTGLAGYFASGGLGEALVQKKEIDDDHYRVVFTLQLLIGVVFYSVFYFTAPLLSAFFNDPIYGALIQVSAISFMLAPLSNMHRTRLRRDMRFKAMAGVGLTSLTVAGTTSIYLALNNFGPWSLVFGGLAGEVTSMIVLRWLVKWRPAIYFNAEIAKPLSQYGVKTSVNEILVYFRGQTANFLLAKFSSPANVGLFNKADSLNMLPLTVIGSSVYQPIFRSLSMIQDDIDKTRYVFLKTVSLLALYMLPFYVGLYWLAEPFIFLVYGESWLGAVEVLEILAFLGVIFCVGYPAGAILAAQDWLGREIYMQLISWVILIVGCYVGLEWGVTGVALAVIVSRLYSVAHIFWLVHKCIGVKLKQLFESFQSGLMLNFILFFVFYGIDFLFFEFGIGSRSWVYFFGMVMVSVLVYVFIFLFARLKGLGDESLRWRKVLRIP